MNLDHDLGSARATLAMAGLLQKAIIYWIKIQISDESPLSQEGRKELVSKHLKNSTSENVPEVSGLLESETFTRVSVDSACLAWAEKHWGHRLETIFLEHKSGLDRASCSLLRVSDKGLALELYHRIKAGEAEFSVCSYQFGKGPEVAKGGLISLRQMSQMPLGLEKVLPVLEPGELLSPRRLGDMFAIVKLVKYVPARFDEPMRQQLLLDELREWLQKVGELALAHLVCSY